MAKPDFSLQPIEEQLSYEPDTGLIRRKISRGRWKAGDVAGWPDTCGYLMVGVNRGYLLAHRLAWYLHYGEWPQGEIDHINGDPKDNRIANLRVVTRQQNAQAMGRRKDSRSGIRGVRQHQGKWYARIKIDNKDISRGPFQSKDEAHRAMLVLSRDHYGQYATARLTAPTKLNTEPRNQRQRRNYQPKS